VKASKSGVKRQAKPRRGTRLVIGGASLVVLAAFALPTSVLMLAGMIPAGVAAIVDRHPRKLLARTVATMNFAGVMPFAIKLWVGVNSMTGLASLLASPFSWLAFYGAAGIGWLLYLGAPAVTTLLMRQSLVTRRETLETLQRNLIKEWGEEIAKLP
jgi:hypothetical protein